MRIALLLALALALPSGAALAVESQLESVGNEMGYRMFGDAKKNRDVLVQNSRAGDIDVFDEARGLFVSVPKYSDVNVPCRGQDRLLKIRFRDSFRESVPFQLRIECGREVQFITPAQIAAPRALARSAFSVANEGNAQDDP